MNSFACRKRLSKIITMSSLTLRKLQLKKWAAEIKVINYVSDFREGRCDVATLESFADNLSSFKNALLEQTTVGGGVGNQVKRFSIKRSKAKVGDTGSQESGVIGTLTSRCVGILGGCCRLQTINIVGLLCSSRSPKGKSTPSESFQTVLFLVIVAPVEQIVFNHYHRRINPCSVNSKFFSPQPASVGRQMKANPFV